MTTGMNIEGVTTAVNLIDDNSDSDDESEAPSLEDPDLSDDKDSDNDDAGDDAQAVNHISFTENVNLGRQERVNQADGDVINHIPIDKNTNGRRQEIVNLVTKTNVTPGGRTQLISPATAGITSTPVEQVARGHAFDEEGRRRKTQK